MGNSHARLQGPGVAQAALSRAHSRLAARVLELEARLDAGDAAWPEFYVAVQTFTSIVPRLGEGEMLTTHAMAQRLGLTTKTLLRHRKNGAIKPTLAKGRLIRWKGDEVLNGNGNGSALRKQPSRFTGLRPVQGRDGYEWVSRGSAESPG